jgi:hypothetical protein
MPLGCSHHLKYTLYVGQRHVVVKKIAHRVDENRLRLLPPERELKSIGVQRQSKPIRIFLLPHFLQAIRHSLGITVIASRAQCIAPRRRIPSGLCPLNRRFMRHAAFRSQIAVEPFWKDFAVAVLPETVACGQVD